MGVMAKLGYLASGLTNRWGRPRTCPACSATAARIVDRKFFHTLNECENCALRYRYPVETPQQMERFYQSAYQQKGITTDLPTDAELANYKATQFKNSGKDATRIVCLLEKLGLPRNARVLDFGASWGYISWQLREAGYEVEAFEISRPRAEFARKLGLDVKTSLADVPGLFDVVFSSHVLEHLPNPLESLRQMADRLNPGGLVVAFTPNGSPEAQQADPRRYRSQWGFVHPVLLTARFVHETRLFPRVVCGSSDEFRSHQLESLSLKSDAELDRGELLAIGWV
jgi:2-polyprenyl-3-methyl-5-hydroxy-6-metoxy-1,4-benzoquinol methylase